MYCTALSTLTICFSVSVNDVTMPDSRSVTDSAYEMARPTRPVHKREKKTKTRETSRLLPGKQSSGFLPNGVLFQSSSLFRLTLDTLRDTSAGNSMQFTFCCRKLRDNERDHPAKILLPETVIQRNRDLWGK